MSIYYVGWDVGAWECAKKENASKSQDAICILNPQDNKVITWTGNIFDEYGTDKCPFIKRLPNILKDIIAKNEIEPDSEIIIEPDSEIIIAVDAALGAPQTARILWDLSCPDINIEKQYGCPRTENTLLYRATERWIDENIFEKNNNPPLSLVRDRIGSQSTKALSVLRSWEMTWSSKELIWHSEDNKIIAIETYPSAARTRVDIDWLKQKLPMILGQDLNQLNWCEKWQKRASLPEQIKEKSDIIDALICAYVAKKYKEGEVCKCESKEYQEAATLEGWIWIPILK